MHHILLTQSASSTHTALPPHMQHLLEICSIGCKHAAVAADIHAALALDTHAAMTAQMHAALAADMDAPLAADMHAALAAVKHVALAADEACSTG